MRALVTLVLIGFAAWIALTVLVPLLGFVLALAIPLGGIVIWLLPIVIIACSDRTTGAEKLAWILAIVFLSWFAWIFYMLLAPISRRSTDRYSREYRDYRDPRGYRHRAYRHD